MGHNTMVAGGSACVLFTTLNIIKMLFAQSDRLLSCLLKPGVVLQPDGRTNIHTHFYIWINQDPHIVFNIDDKYLCCVIIHV